MKMLQVFLILISIGMLGIALKAYVDSLQYPLWKTTKASLDFAYIRNASSPTKAGASDVGSDFGFARYSYSVNGTKYVGSRITPLQNIYFQKEKFKELRAGEVNVSYNPLNPADSFIFLETPKIQIITICVVSSCILLMAFYLRKLVNLILVVSREIT